MGVQAIWLSVHNSSTFTKELKFHSDAFTLLKIYLLVITSDEVMGVHFKHNIHTILTMAVIRSTKRDSHEVLTESVPRIETVTP